MPHAKIIAPNEKKLPDPSVCLTISRFINILFTDFEGKLLFDFSSLGGNSTFKTCH